LSLFTDHHYTNYNNQHLNVNSKIEYFQTLDPEFFLLERHQFT
jgi:hypothetical protein